MASSLATWLSSLSPLSFLAYCFSLPLWTSEMRKQWTPLLARGQFHFLLCALAPSHPVARQRPDCVLRENALVIAADTH